MTSDDYLRLVAGQLIGAGAEVHTASVAGEDALIGYKSDFRLKWFATKVHLFTAVRSVETASGEALARFSNEALAFAVQRKGRLRGLQTGVAAIAVIVAGEATPDAAEWARTHLIRRRSAFAWPVLVDLSAGQVVSHEGRVIYGGIYAAWIREQVAVSLPAPG